MATPNVKRPIDRSAFDFAQTRLEPSMMDWGAAIPPNDVQGAGLRYIAGGDAEQAAPQQDPLALMGVQPVYMDPLDPKAVLAAMGAEDPNAVQARIGERRKKRQATSKSYATGAALGSLAALLVPQADAGAYYRNTSPALAGIQSMVAQDAEARRAEDAQVQAALKRWYDTILKTTELNSEREKANQGAAIKYAEEERERTTPKRSHYYKGADGKMRLVQEFPGGINRQSTLDSFHQDPTEARDRSGLTAAERTRNKVAAMKEMDDWVKKIAEWRAELVQAEAEGNEAEVKRLRSAIEAGQRQLSAWQREGGMREIVGDREGTGVRTITDEGSDLPTTRKGPGLHKGSRTKPWADKLKLQNLKP